MPLPRDREANPVGDAADGRASSRATTLDQNVLLVEEEDGDGEGAGEGADDEQLTRENWLVVWDVTIVQRMGTMARRSRRPLPWRSMDGDDGIVGVPTPE